MKFPSKGVLTDTNFIEILKDASQSALTGMIRAENSPVIKVIYFQKGSISFASSNEKSDRLTEVLKQAGKLTPEQVEDAQSRLKPNVSLGKTLVELGYISAKDLLWGARAQVDGILHHLLFWNQGKYQILEGTLPREIIHLNLTVPVVIFEGIMKTQNPGLSNEVDLFPGSEIRWGLGYMLNVGPGPDGRSPGTVSWGGIFNTYYWLDPAKRVTGLIMTQILPFADHRALKLYGQFESAVYEALPSA